MTASEIEIEAVISDWGGVLTAPLVGSFMGFSQETGIPLEELGIAMARVAEREAAHPLFELECGRISEQDFLRLLADQLREQLGRDVPMHEFPERYWQHVRSNPEMVDLLAGLRGEGYRTALLTNNVREWEPRWRAMLPVDEIFEVVVDSAFVGMRKPSPEIYTLTLERLGVAAERCLFIDDIELNVTAAREVGMQAVHFRDNAQAISEIRTALGATAPRA